MIDWVGVMSQWIENDSQVSSLVSCLFGGVSSWENFKNNIRLG